MSDRGLLTGGKFGDRAAENPAARPENFPALGFDPAPGSVGAVDALAQTYSAVSTELAGAYEALSRIGQHTSSWQGEAAAKFHEQVDDLPPYLDKAVTSFTAAARAMQTWATDLGSMQQTAGRYEAEAQDMLDSLRRAQANPDLNLAGQHFPDDASLAQAQNRLELAEAAVESAKRSLEEIRDQARRLLEQHTDLAEETAAALRKARDEAPDKPGMFDSLMGGVGHLVTDPWDFAQDHAETIAKVGDVLSVAGGVLSVCAMATAPVPILGEVTIGAAIAVNAAALGTHALAKAAGADVGMSKFAMDGLGVIPGGGAFKGLGAVTRAPKAIKATVQGVQGATDGRKLASVLPSAKAAWQEASEQAAKSPLHFYNEHIAGNILPKVPGLVDAADNATKVATTVNLGAGLGTTGAIWYLQPHIDAGLAAAPGYVGSAPSGVADAFVNTWEGMAGPPPVR